MAQALPDISIFVIICAALNFLFMAWPFVLLAALQQRHHIVQALITLWVFLAVARVVIIFDSQPLWPSLLISEPFNTSLFVFTGMVIFSALFLRRLVVKH